MFCVLAGALACFFIGMQVVRSGEPLGLDQGLFATFGRFVPEGLLPYRDIFDTKPPLFLYLWVAAWVLGKSTAGVWLLQGAWLACTLAVAGLLVGRLWGRYAGLGAAAFLLVGLSAPGLGGYTARAQAEELAALPGVAAAFLALAACGRPRLAFATGIVMGLVGLMKVPALAMAAAWLLLWLTTGLRGAVARASLFFVGMLVPWGAAAIFFAAHGALGEAVFAVFFVQGHYSAVIAPPWAEVLLAFGRAVVAEFGIMLVPAGAGIVALVQRDRQQAAWLVLWLGSAMAGVLVQRQLAGYHFLLVVPALAVAAGMGLTRLTEWASKARGLARLTVWSLLAATVLFAGATALAWQKEYALDVAYVLGRIDRETYLRRLAVGTFSPATEEAVARFLKEKVPQGETILVWGLSPGVYALSGRQPATKYPFHKVLLTDAPLSVRIGGLEARREAFLRALRSRPPKAIVVGRGDANGFEPEDSLTSLGRFAGLAAFVAERYTRYATIGRFEILLRNENEGSLSPRKGHRGESLACLQR